jgi:hypothetical protein
MCVLDIDQLIDHCRGALADATARPTASGSGTS